MCIRDRASAEQQRLLQDFAANLHSNTAQEADEAPPDAAPVSYTHLDVYKRQSQRQLPGLCARGLE